MHRRRFVCAITAVSTCLRISTAMAQRARLPRLGFLLFNSPTTDPLSPLLHKLDELGFADGKTISMDYRFAQGNPEALFTLALEVVQLKPDVIFAFGGDVASAVKTATDSIPIVAVMSNDPVKSGLVASIGRPAGNVTGITLIYDELAGKTLGFLKEAAPSISRVAVLWNPDHTDPEFRETERAGRTVGIRIQSLEVRRPEDFDRAFKAAIEQRAEGLVVVSSRLMSRQRPRIAEFAARNRVIVAGGWGDWTRDGALLTYGPNTTDLMGRVATYIVKIIKGARPSELAVERPTNFELVLNLKTAKAFGLVLPPSLLARADKVI